MTEAMTQARAEVRLRPGTAVLDRGDGEVQLGTDHRWALVVAGLSDAEASWLCEAAARRHRSLEQTARRWAVEDARRAEVLELLERSGFLVGPPPPAGRITAPADGAADAAVLGALRPDGAGQVTLAARARRTVGLCGLGRVGAAAALHLATAGVGTLVLDDPRPVQTCDTGLGGYRRDDVGTPRERALTELLAERHPRTDVVHEVDGREPDAVVVVEPDVADPDRYGRLLGDGVPHLPVVVREADVVVGPLVLPGRSACVRCAHRHVADADARWPRLVQQLRGREPDRPQETTLAANAAALAAGQVLALLDGARPAAVGAALEVALPEAVPRVRPVQPHPGCGCTGLVPAG
ncbi:UBA/ThiF-type NAD/FAD-binding protein [Isoptericola variabilis]|uniref:UBA/ThiF-type NAD/FAD binding protein n=1 Tax=Isoptericola variabilis (strain 225) TaxID=743718 RepID=F6FXB7_ISOV2|nr:UBA/ThiF-type NAD/FAD-binding protein [Isoptericola variabilis]AEG43620.1 UBA/ThiF-type NAD/FAD binding protein [Isoptericola variabilis 225]